MTVDKLKTPLSPQMLHFVDGERYKFVEVQIIDDAIPEGAERFQLILSEPSPGLELGTNTTGRQKGETEYSVQNLFVCVKQHKTVEISFQCFFCENLQDMTQIWVKWLD